MFPSDSLPPSSAPAPSGAGTADSFFGHFSRLMRRSLVLFSALIALFGLLVLYQYEMQRQAAALTAQSHQAFSDLTQLRLRLSDLQGGMAAFQQLQNPELLAPLVACGALCDHLPRLARHVADSPEMHERVLRAMVWDARLAGSLSELLAAARADQSQEAIGELLADARDVELMQLRRKIDEIAQAEVQTFAGRQATAAAATGQLLVALGLVLLTAAGAMLWLHRQARRVAYEGLRTEEAARALALQDALTGLPNRRMLAESAPLLLNRARRQQQAVALMMVDLDGFKQINDDHGHAAGDVLLQAVATRMRDTLRDGDLLVRLGGDEFVVLLDGSSTADEVLRVGQRLVEAVGRPVEVAEGTEATVSASIGLACFPADGQRLDGLLAAADGALYTAKRAGRNRLCRAGRELVTHVLSPLPPLGAAQQSPLRAVGSTAPLRSVPSSSGD